MRIVIIGISGAGKSTMARRLATALAVPHVELDALYWEPGWRPAAPEVFHARAEAATAGPAWVVDGNYSAVRPIVWTRATHLVWLDYDRAPIMWRVIRRSIGRAVSGRELWNGNRERWQSWWHASHPIRWAWSQWRGRRVALEALLARGDFPHLAVRRLRRPAEAETAIRGLLNPPA
jgi:adenylate kinase family enzyme